MLNKFHYVGVYFLATMLVSPACDAAPNQADIPQSDYAPTLSSDLYQGPFGAWLSAKDTTMMLIEGLEPEKIGQPGTYSTWWKRTIDSHIYGIHVARDGLMVRLLGSGEEKIRTRKDVLIISGIDHFGVRWWARITRFSRTENCAFEIKVLSEPGPEGRKRGLPGLPAGTILHTWQCWDSSTGKSTKIWDEAVHPDGTVLQPSGQGEEWLPAEPGSCWTCDPERIPEEVRFQEDPLIQYLLQQKE